MWIKQKLPEELLLMCVTLSLDTDIILDKQGVVAQMVQKLSAGRASGDIC